MNGDALDLDALQKLADGATPGPWELEERSGRDYTDEWWYEVDVKGVCSLGDREESTADAKFIAAARTAVPALLDLVASQAAEIAQLRAERDRLSDALGCAAALLSSPEPS